MTQKKSITFLIKVMNGGGAERVVTILSKALVEKGYRVNLILTHQKKADALLTELDEKIKVFSLEDEISGKDEVFTANFIMLGARLKSRIMKFLCGEESKIALIEKYYSRNYIKVKWLNDFFSINDNGSIIAFMYDSIFLTLLSKTQNNRVIISERGDPSQYIKSKTTEAFISGMFGKADTMVFQSPDVKEWYNNKFGLSGTVIYNSIKSELPEKYEGERKKRIVNFCRISPEKNLALLIESFARLNNEFPEYELYIYGDANDAREKAYKREIENLINNCGCREKIFLLPAKKDIHKVIVDYKMFVSSSDHEGMSNSMLEAMAIGVPVICTDCPAGGTRAIISNRKNGLLIPIRNSESLYIAMKELIEDSALAEYISNNATDIKTQLSVEKIVEKWEALL